MVVPGRQPDSRTAQMKMVATLLVLLCVFVVATLAYSGATSWSRTNESAREKIPVGILGDSDSQSYQGRPPLGSIHSPAGGAFHKATFQWPEVLARIRAYAAGSPFVIGSVVVGNVQYPEEVADAVARKLAATQELQRKDTEIEIERKERTKREVQAQGLANAMQIIRGQLSSMYIQHEAIEAQKSMVNSPNHTVVYIPVGPMGVPVTGTFPTVPAQTQAAASPAP